jgi:hypothetical protein
MKTTFWNLLKRYHIEIPKIQRDYAQGRKTKEIEKIADKFVKDLVCAIVDFGELNLDFVYGKVEKEVLIPLDGQQRLTTLFLIHWYLAVKENKINESNNKLLLKFSYETRTSSIDFCKNLINRGIDYSNVSESISEIIIDSNWYFLSWDLDPTVSSMLHMLDKIHHQLRDVKEDLFERLINEDSKVITFEFLSLESFKLTDELYIKMNARGKPLTLFEKFKAIFSGYLKDLEQQSKLDNDWLDIFWTIEKEKAKKEKVEIETQKVDERFFNFFQNISLNFYSEANPINKLLQEYDLFDIQEQVFANSANVEKVIKILDSLSEFDPENVIFVDFQKSNAEISYWERLRFHALALFFLKIGKLNIENEITLKRWLRITLNLINNSLIQSTENYQDALKSLNELSQNLENIYSYLSQPENNVKHFSRLQRAEESQKAKIILADEEWEKLFIQVEQDTYFDGQIGFILKYANDFNESYDKDVFKDYSKKLLRLFNNEFQDNHDFLFQRALLSKGDYLPQIGEGSNYTFCVFDQYLRSKLDNWRKVFNDEKKSLVLKDLLDTIRINTLFEDLSTVVQTHQVKDWRKHFINDPEQIEYCAKRLIRRCSEDEIYLLTKTQMNGRHRELYSWKLFIQSFQNRMFSPFTKEAFYIESTSWNKPIIILENLNYNALNIWIEISYDKYKEYNVTLYEKNDISLPSSIINIINKSGFINNSITLPKSIIESQVLALCKSLDSLNMESNAG